MIKSSNCAKFCTSFLAGAMLFVNLAVPVSAASHEAVKHEGTHHTTNHATAHTKKYHEGVNHPIMHELEANTKVMYRVNAAKLNERTGPGVSHHKVGTLKKNTLVEIKELSPDGKWALAHTGTWLSVKYLEKDTPKHHEHDKAIAAGYKMNAAGHYINHEGHRVNHEGHRLNAEGHRINNEGHRVNHEGHRL
ncbi:MAG: SH3 domain-containing protein [Lachnospiraceae bacterium]|nr:SH3 domain-containing protein [Lachnospiraceae bacterium]